MPLYEFLCPDCGTADERFTPSRHDSQYCRECGASMRYVLSAPNLKGDNVMKTWSSARQVDGPPSSGELARHMGEQ